MQKNNLDISLQTVVYHIERECCMAKVVWFHFFERRYHCELDAQIGFLLFLLSLFWPSLTSSFFISSSSKSGRTLLRESPSLKNRAKKRIACAKWSIAYFAYVKARRGDLWLVNHARKRKEVIRSWWNHDFMNPKNSQKIRGARKTWKGWFIVDENMISWAQKFPKIQGARKTRKGWFHELWIIRLHFLVRIE